MVISGGRQFAKKLDVGCEEKKPQMNAQFVFCCCCCSSNRVKGNSNYYYKEQIVNCPALSHMPTSGVRVEHVPKTHVLRLAEDISPE
jgi:hypothetical protein